MLPSTGMFDSDKLVRAGALGSTKVPTDNDPGFRARASRRVIVAHSHPRQIHV